MENGNTIQNAIIILLLILIIYYLMNYFQMGKEGIVASDGEKYFVVSGYENSKGAAELLSRTNRNVMSFLRYLKIKYRVNYTEGAEMYNREAMEAIMNSYDSINKKNTTGFESMITGAYTRFVDSIRPIIKGEGFWGTHSTRITHNHYSRARSSQQKNDHIARSTPQSQQDAINGHGITEALVGNAHSDAEMSNIGNEFSKTAVNRLLTGYDLENIMENDPKAPGENTYTVDKGAKMLVCLRNRENYQLHDDHIVMFVVLHELAHIANERWGHSSESQFWEIFKFLLHEAKLCGVHIPRDYSLHPVKYCGMNVDYNPYFDEGIRKLW